MLQIERSAKELVALQPDLILSTSAPTTAALLQQTRAIPMMQVPDIDRLLKEFALGELWYLLGEEKLFEVQPA